MNMKPKLPDDFVSQKWDINGKKAELGIAKA